MKLRYFTCCLCTLLLFFTLLPASLAHATPTQAGQITEYPLPSEAVPLGITSGPDGNLWFTEEYSKTIGRITTQGKIKEYPICACCPIDITSGPDGDLWFTMTYDNGDVATSYIGRITPQGKTTLHLLFTDFTHPWGITTGPDGNIWFTVYENEGEEDWNDYIGMMTPRGKSTLIPAGTFVHPFYQPGRMVTSGLPSPTEIRSGRSPCEDFQGTDHNVRVPGRWQASPLPAFQKRFIDAELLWFPAPRWRDRQV